MYVYIYIYIYMVKHYHVYLQECIHTEGRNEKRKDERKKLHLKNKRMKTFVNK